MKAMQSGMGPVGPTNVQVYTPIPKNMGLNWSNKLYDKSEVHFLLDSMDAFKKCLLKW